MERVFLGLPVFWGLTAFWGLTSFSADQDFFCKTSKTPGDFYQCSLNEHPRTQEAVISEKIGDSIFDKARQFQNPELGLRSMTGQNAGESRGGTELSLSFPVTQFFFRRPLEIKIAESQKKSLAVESQLNTLNARLEVLNDLFRWRQTELELSYVSDALNRFKQIENQFLARPARGPEQEITLSLVELAQGEYQVKKNSLLLERHQIQSRFRTFLGEKFEFKSDYLPQFKRNWPDLASLVPKPLPFDQSLELRKLRLDLDRLSAEREMAEANTYPILMAGPNLQRNTEGPNVYYTYGVSLNVSIPILNWNLGGRRLAQYNFDLSSLQNKVQRQRSFFESEHLVERYEQAVNSLKDRKELQLIQQKHKMVDQYFKRGLVSGTVILEIHRQIIGFTEAQHLHELVAVEAMARILALQNLDPSGVLN